MTNIVIFNAILPHLITRKKIAEIKEALQLLIELAKQKANTFPSEIQKDLLDGKLNDTTLKVPITRVIGKYKEFRVKTSETTDIAKDIKDAIVTIFDGNGNVANGIAQLNPKGLWKKWKIPLRA